VTQTKKQEKEAKERKGKNTTGGEKKGTVIKKKDQEWAGCRQAERKKWEGEININA